MARLKGLLTPAVSHECVPVRNEGGVLEVACSYHFTVTSAESQIVQADFKYLISYQLETEETFSEGDIAQFAFANGTYHSWPFVRQMIFDLTSRMGYPPYTLPVFKFNPKPQAKPEPEPQAKAQSD
jgi:preprotein translocase subunit SecB